MKMASFNRIATITVMMIVCLGGALSLQCASCYYDEDLLSASGDYACVNDPTTVSTVSCDTMCYTWGYYYTFWGNMDLRVERGCASESENSTWLSNGCSGNYTVESIYEAYVCTCDTSDSCNTDDQDYHKCYECESSLSEDYNCRSAVEDNYSPVPCLTGHTGCGMETISYNSWLFNDFAERYCTDTETTDPDGDCSTNDFGYETCTYYCSADACNSQSAANGVIYSIIVMALVLTAPSFLR